MFDLQDADIVVAIKSKDKKLMSPSTRVYVRQDSKLRPIGLIQDLDLKANTDNILVDLRITLPSETNGMSEAVKESIRESSALLVDKGCAVSLK